MHIENVRVEKCGRVHLGEYCLHFHFAGDCPQCVFRGNVVTYGTNKGITVHATHHSLVDRNVVYDIRGAFLYVEDGNEYENTIRFGNGLFVPCSLWNDQSVFVVYFSTSSATTCLSAPN